MGIAADLLTKGYRMTELREVGDDGRRTASVDPIKLLDDAGSRYVSIARSDLVATIYSGVHDRVETIFGDSVTGLIDAGGQVHVQFESGTSAKFDLVVGADGLHSRVRDLTFGPMSDYERDRGIMVAALELSGYRPREELVALSHADVGVQVLRVSVRDDRTLVMATFRHDGDAPGESAPAQQKFIRARLHGLGWEVPAMLEQMPHARSIYLERASQIRMPSWTKGRIALIGDAAASPSLLAGQGSALAMVEAYVLASELYRSHDDHAKAFAAYESQLIPFVLKKQNAALRLGAAFAPRNRTQVALRRVAMRLAAFPPIAKAVMGRTLADQITLPPAPFD